jgi:hypothetical protein
MGQPLIIPHRPAHGMCPVNGIRDLVHWRTGRDWSNQFVYGLGQGGGFAYLRFNMADPPRQIFWGVAGPRQHAYLAELFEADYSEVENRSFRFSWKKAQEAVDAGRPPVLGPLDMFYLNYYEGIYRRRHIPIHYVLLVGYDDRNAYVHDTDMDAVQRIPLDELQSAWEVNVPGLGKRNRLMVMDIPETLGPSEALIRKSIADQSQMMLYAPVSMVGIAAMRKAAREIAGWPAELGEETAAICLRQVLEYLNSPPDIEGDHLTAGRDVYLTFLEEAAEMAGLELAEGVGHLRQSMALIPHLAEAVRQNRLEEAADCFRRIADAETAAHREFGRAVGLVEPSPAG